MTSYKITFNEQTDVGKNILAFLKQNEQYIKLENPYKMGNSEDLDKLFEEAHKDQKEGKCVTLNTFEDIDNFINDL